MQAVIKMTPFFPEDEGTSLSHVRPVRQEGAGNVAVGHASPNDFSMMWMNPIQQKVWQSAEPPKFDGQSKNWPQFRRNWTKYLSMVDPGNKLGELEKSVSFKRQLPPHLVEEIEAHEMTKKSLQSYLAKLEIRFGNTDKI